MKNPWWGLKCQNCDQIFDSNYSKDPHYAKNSCHTTLMDIKIFYCGKCNEKSIEELNAHRKLKKGIGRANEQIL